MPNFNVSYLVGDSYKRDHPFWPTRTVDELYPPEIPGSQRFFERDYPFALTLEQIECLMWRVREWTVDASTWEASSPAFDVPIVGQDDIAELNDEGSTPAFTFKEQRYIDLQNLGNPFRAVTDERDRLAEWLNYTLPKDFHSTTEEDIPIWKTLRNLGVGHQNQAPDWEVDDDPNQNGVANPNNINFTYSFTEPYNHDKFGESGSGTVGVLRFLLLAGYTAYNPDSKLFYPPFIMSSILPRTRTGRDGVVFYLLPNDPSPVPPGQDPDILVGTLTLKFGEAAEDATCKIAITRGPDYSGGPFVVPVPTGEFSLVINATKFWPYLNTLGELCYDETTGASTGADPFA